MATRSYSMKRRAEQQAGTRRLLVDAAVALHAEKGILNTKPAEIASRADVALTTYYKHFPSLGTLVTACTTRGLELIPPPNPATLLALAPNSAQRIAPMVRMLFEYYQAREPWVYVGRTEQHLIPELRPVVDRQGALRDAFVDAALGPGTDPKIAGVIAALVDFWAWRTLRRERGLSQEEVISTVTAAVQRVADAGVVRGPQQTDKSSQ